MKKSFIALASLLFCASIYSADNVVTDVYNWQGATNNFAITLDTPSKNFCIVFEANPRKDFYVGLYSDSYAREASTNICIVANATLGNAPTKQILSAIIEMVYGGWTNNANKGTIIEQKNKRALATGYILPTPITGGYLSSSSTVYKTYKYTVTLDSAFTVKLSCFNQTTAVFDDLMVFTDANFNSITKTDTNLDPIAQQTESLLVALKKNSFKGFTKVGFVTPIATPYTVRNVIIVDYDVLEAAKQAAAKANTQETALNNLEPYPNTYLFDATTNKDANTIINDIGDLRQTKLINNIGPSDYLNSSPLPAINSAVNARAANTIIANAKTIFTNETARAAAITNYLPILRRAAAFNTDYSTRLQQFTTTVNNLTAAINNAQIALNKLNTASAQYTAYSQTYSIYKGYVTSFTTTVDRYRYPSDLATAFNNMPFIVTTITVDNITQLTNDINTAANTAFQTITTAATAAGTSAQQKIALLEQKTTDQITQTTALLATLNNLNSTITEKQTLLTQANNIKSALQSTNAFVAQQKPIYAVYVTNPPTVYKDNTNAITYAAAASAKQAADNVIAQIQPQLDAGLVQSQLSINFIKANATLLTISYIYGRLKNAQLAISAGMGPEPTPECQSTESIVSTQSSGLFNTFKSLLWMDFTTTLASLNQYSIPLNLNNAPAINTIITTVDPFSAALASSAGIALLAQIPTLDLNVSAFEKARFESWLSNTPRAAQAAKTSLDALTPIITAELTNAQSALSEANALDKRVTNKQALINEITTQITTIQKTQTWIADQQTMVNTAPANPSADEAQRRLILLSNTPTTADSLAKAVQTETATILLKVRIAACNAFISTMQLAIDNASHPTNYANQLAEALLATAQSLSDTAVDQTSQKTKAQIISELQALSRATITINNTPQDTVAYLASIQVPPALTIDTPGITPATILAAQKSYQDREINICEVKDKANVRVIQIASYAEIIVRIVWATLRQSLKDKITPPTQATAITVMANAITIAQDSITALTTLIPTQLTSAQAALAKANTLDNRISEKQALIAEITATIKTIQDVQSWLTNQQAKINQFKAYTYKINDPSQIFNDWSVAMLTANSATEYILIGTAAVTAIPIKIEIAAANLFINDTKLLSAEGIKTTNISDKLASDLLAQAQLLSDTAIDPGTQKPKKQIITELQALATVTITKNGVTQPILEYLQSLTLLSLLNPTDPGITIDSATQTKNANQKLAIDTCAIKDNATARLIKLSPYISIVSATFWADTNQALNTALPLATSANQQATALVETATKLPDIVTNKAELLLQAQALTDNKQTPPAGTQISFDYITTQIAALPKTAPKYTTAEQAAAGISALKPIKEFAESVKTSNETVLKAISDLKKTIEETQSAADTKAAADSAAAKDAAEKAAALAAKSQEANTAITDTIKALNDAVPLATTTNEQATTLIETATKLPDTVTNKADLITQAQALQDNKQNPPAGTQITLNYLNDQLKTVPTTTKTYTTPEQAADEITTLKPIKEFAESVKTSNETVLKAISDLKKTIEDAKTAADGATAKEAAELATKSQEANTAITDTIKALNEILPLATAANEQAASAITMAAALPDTIAKKTDLLAQARALQNNGQTPPSGTQVTVDYINSSLKAVPTATKTYNTSALATADIDALAPIKAFIVSVKNNHTALLTSINDLSKAIDGAKIATDLNKAIDDANAIIANVPIITQQAKESTKLANDLGVSFTHQTEALPDNAVDQTSQKTKAQILTDLQSLATATVTVDNTPIDTITYLDKVVTPPSLAANDTGITIESAQEAKKSAETLVAIIGGIKDKANDRSAALRSTEEIIKALQATAPTTLITPTDTNPADTQSTVETVATLNKTAQTSYDEVKKALAEAQAAAQELNDAASKVVARAQSLPTTSPNRDSLIKSAEFIQDDKATDPNGTQVNLTYLASISAAFTSEAKTYTTIADAQKDIDTATGIKTKIKEITESKATVLKSINDLDAAVTKEQEEISKREQIATAITQLTAAITKAATMAMTTSEQSAAIKASALSTLNSATNLPSSVQKRQSLIDQITILQTGSTRINNAATNNDDYLTQVEKDLPKLPITTGVLEEITAMTAAVTKIMSNLEAIITEITTRQANIKSLADSISAEQNTADAINGQLAISTTAARRAISDATTACDSIKTITIAVNGEATTALNDANNLTSDAIDPASQKNKQALIDELTKIKTGSLTVNGSETETLSYLTQLQSSLPASSTTFDKSDLADAATATAVKVKAETHTILADTNTRRAAVAALQQSIIAAQQSTAAALSGLSQQANALIVDITTTLNNTAPLAQISITQAQDAVALLQNTPATLPNKNALTTTAQKNLQVAQANSDYLIKVGSAVPKAAQTYTMASAAQKDIAGLTPIKTFLDTFVSQNDILVKTITENRLAIADAITQIPVTAQVTPAKEPSMADALAGLKDLSTKLNQLTSRLNTVLATANSLPATTAVNWIKSDCKKRQTIFTTTGRSIKTMQDTPPTAGTIIAFNKKTGEFITVQEKTIISLESSIEKLRTASIQAKATNSSRR